MNTSHPRPPQQGQTVHLFGNMLTFVMRGADTGMRFSMVEAYTAPGAGSPPHLHHDDEESFYVLEGTYRIAVGDEERLCGPGTITTVAKGVPHAFANAGETPARMLIMNWPADHHERFFMAVGDAAPAGSRDFPAPKAPDLAAVAAAAQASGIELLPPK
jgi:mannose-6-phosphate isomerase-like protein (cupin superfamily)